ncbi:uncharacterized protein [Anabrus simplex]|uniref:uncharacterized protein n=1 Tax=Anabrus simplex TaxID=316456 RepID=UPI0034DCFD30
MRCSSYFVKLKMAASRAASSANDKSLIDRIKELELKPLTTENLMYYYMPLQGAVGYTFLSVNVMNPTLVSRLIPNYDIANILLCSSLVGSGLYIYDRPHMRLAPSDMRLGFSIYGAVMFSLGSVLLWAIIRSFVPKNVFICSVIGVSSGVGLMNWGMSYLSYIDSKLKSLPPKK